MQTALCALKGIREAVVDVYLKGGLGWLAGVSEGRDKRIRGILNAAGIVPTVNRVAFKTYCVQHNLLRCDVLLRDDCCQSKSPL